VRFPSVLLMTAVLGLMLYGGSLTGAQSADPGAEKKEILIGLLPKKTELPELKGRSVPEFYEPQNLFDYMNGQADMYLDYGFILLITREYTARKDSILTLEIYRMESPLHAFGIHAAERSPEDKAVNFGAEGFLGANMLGFWKDSYYCRILFYERSPELDAILLKTGRSIADKIAGSSRLPERFSIFPSEFRIKGSERFIPRNFLGQAYLKNGYRVDFDRGGRRTQAFLLETGSGDEAQEQVRKFQEFLREGRENVSPLTTGDIEMVWVKGERDKFLFRHGSSWGGVLDEKDPGVARQTMEAMVERLKARGQ
jgi:hypothetical protein